MNRQGYCEEHLLSGGFDGRFYHPNCHRCKHAGSPTSSVGSLLEGSGQVGRVAQKSWKLNAWLCVAVIPPQSQAATRFAPGRTVPRNNCYVQENMSGSSSPSVTAIVITKKAIPEQLPKCFPPVMRYISSGSLDRATALVLGVPPMIPCAVHYLAPR